MVGFLGVLIAISISGCTTPCGFIKKAGWKECRLDVTRALEPGTVLLVDGRSVTRIDRVELSPVESDEVEIAGYNRRSNWAFDLGAGLPAVPGLPPGAEVKLKSSGAKKVKVGFSDSREHYFAALLDATGDIELTQQKVDELLATLDREQLRRMSSRGGAGMEIWLVLSTLTSKVSYSFHSSSDTSFSAPIPLEGIVLTPSIGVKDELERAVVYRNAEPIAYNAVKLSVDRRAGLQSGEAVVKATRVSGGPNLAWDWKD